MLKPDYFDYKSDRIIEIYRQLEDFIIKDISRRLLRAEKITATADRLIWKLQQMGEHREEILKKLQRTTGLSEKELKSLLQESVMTSWEDDFVTLKDIGVQPSNPLENPAVISVIDAEYKKSLGELKNLTLTTMDNSQQDLINMLDEVELRVASGVQSYSAAVCDILDRYAGRGVYVSYPSGARRSLESAVRMCVVTSMNQTAAQVTNQYIVEAKSEYVLVSAHLGARTQQEGQPELAGHNNWQGKVYKISGRDTEHRNLEEATGYRIDINTGTGTVIDPLGLHGYNCRHGHKPWDLRFKNPYIDDNGNPTIDTEESNKRYELLQHQRALERTIRKTKRRLLEKQEQIDMITDSEVKGNLQNEYDKMASDLIYQNKKYNDFCKKNNLPAQYDRMKTSGFGRKETNKANDRAMAYKKKNSEEK